MLSIKCFTVNPYQENTWLISDSHGACAIIDPGCYSASEQAEILEYVSSQKLTPVLLLNTHGHIDHMLGNAWAVSTFQIPFHTHRLVVNELEVAPAWGTMMGLKAAPSPAPDHLLEEGDIVRVGEEELEVLFTPGHSEGHISFFHRKEGHLFSGDVLFQQSIGRTDLPGGHYPTLMTTIHEKLLPLGDQVIVYPGHGPTTTLAAEKATNPFLMGRG
ncbi:MAG: MBL fold metallo-hydrolase [Bacteroidia bacterium]|nr:MBL fold metallo-hydrolase [Bacteroidia bacterium]